MADIRTLTLKFEVNYKDIKVLGATAGKSLSQVDKAGREAESTFSRLNKTLGISAASLLKYSAIATGVLTGISVFAIKQAIDFESSFAGIRKTVNATEAEFAALEKGMRELAKTIPVNVNELNRIGEAAGQLGIQTENILEFTEIMAKLGVTTNLSSEQAATALARLANITKLPQSEFDRLGSTIVALGNNLATTEAEIVEFGLRLEGAGAQIGLSEAQILGMGAALSSLGLEAEAGGSAFSKTMIEIASAVETGNKNLSQFAAVAGLSSQEFSDLFRRDAIAAIDAFVTGLGKMESRGTSTLQVLESLGITEIRMRDALLRASGAGDLLTRSLEIAEEAWKENNALTKEAEQRFKTTASQLTLLWNRIKDISIVLGSGLLPYLNDLVNRVSDWIARNEKLIEQDIKNFIKGVEAAAKNLSIAFSALSGDIDGSKGAFQTLGTTMLTVNEIILVTVKGIAGIQSAITLYKQGLLKLQQLAPPAWRASLTEQEQTRESVEKSERALRQMFDAIKDIEELNSRLAHGILFPETARQQAEAARKSVQGLLGDEKELDAAQQILNRSLAEGKRKTGELGDNLPLPPLIPLGEPEKLKAAQDAIDNLNESILKENEGLIEQIRLLGLEGKKRIEVEAAILKEKGVKNELVEINKALKLTQLELNEQLEKFRELVDDFPIVEFVKNLGDAETLLSKIESIKFVSTGFGLSVPFITLKEDAAEAVEDVKDKLDSLPDFVGSVAAEINTIFADLIFRVLKGNFDNMKDFWKSALNSMLQTFAQFVATIISNPIRIGLEAILGGSGGGGSGGGGLDFGKILGGIGAFFGKGFTALKSVFSGAAFAGSFTSIISTIGSALSFVGAIAAGVFTIVTAVLGFLKKTPRLDIDFDSVKTEMGRRAAFVSEILDEDFFVNEIAQISVKRGAGLGAGGDTAIKEAIQKVLEGTIEAVQSIIFKLPADLAKQLNEALLNTQVDIETVVGGERLLEFDAKGKEIKKKFEAFINGELSAKFLFAIRDFFVGAFESLGVLPDKAQAFIDEQFERFKNAGSREARAEIGKELLESFNAFVDAFNIVSGNVNDSISQTIQNVNALAADLGFEAVPSIGELRQELGKLLENAELDPETVQKYADLRNAIVQAIADIGAAINGLIGKIDALNQTIVNFGGGAAIDLGPFLDKAVTEFTNFFKANVGDLSLSEQEAFLDEIAAFANAQLQAEQAAFAAEQAAMQAAAEAQKQAIQSRIDGLQKEKDRINEAFRERIDALNEELRIAEDFARLTESIRDTLDSIVFSPESVLTPVEQVSALQTRIGDLQSRLDSAIDPEMQLKLADELRGAFQQLFESAGDAFGVNSPEFVAIFDQVTGGLESLADETAARGRSVEEISAEIERLTAENEKHLAEIDAKIQAAQDKLASISSQVASNTFKMSEDLKATFEFLRDEYIRILEERFDQLGELTGDGFASELEAANAIAETAEAQLSEIQVQTGLLTNIRDLLERVQGFAGGSGGVRDFGTGSLAVLHGREAILPERQLKSLIMPTPILPGFMNQVTRGGESHLVHDLRVDIGGLVRVEGNMSDESLERFADKLGKSIAKNTKEEITREIETGGRLRLAVQSAGKRSLN